MPFDPCAATHKFKKKKKKMKSQDIGFMTLLQGAQYLHHSQILGD